MLTSRETGVRQDRAKLRLFQRTGHAADPKLHARADGSGSVSPRTTTSDTAKRPPGFSTRKPRASTRRLSADRLMTQLEMMTSTERRAAECASMSPFRNSTFSTPAFALIRRGQRQHLVGHVEAVGLARSDRRAGRRAARRCRRRSRGRAPSRRRCSSASAVGLPQPSEASTASCGRHAVSACAVEIGGDRIGGVRKAALPPQQLERSPAITRSAAAPYFSRTVSLISLRISHGISLLIKKSLIYGIKKNQQQLRPADLAEARAAALQLADELLRFRQAPCDSV